MPFRPLVTACVLAAATLFFYGLRSGPLTPEEHVFLAGSRSVAAKPQLFYHAGDGRWLQPLGLYLTAIVHAVGGGEGSGRIAGAIVGAVNVGLIYVAAHLLFNHAFLGLAAALLLMIMPAHWWFAIEGTSAIYPMPFVLTWLAGVAHFLERDESRSLAIAGTGLAVGMLTHPTAPLTMVWLCVLTLVVVPMRRDGSLKNLLWFGAPMAVMFVLLGLYYGFYPDTYNDTFGRWAIFKAHLRFPLDGLAAQVNWNTLGNRASTFWGLLDPSFLFFMHETRGMPPLPTVCAALIPLGFVRVIEWEYAPRRAIVLGSLLVPALVTATFGVARDLGGTLPAIAGFALLGGAGVEWLGARFKPLPDKPQTSAA